MVAILKGIFDLFKEPVRYAVALGVVAAIVLFSPNSFISMLGLLKYRDEGKPYLGGLLLICFAICIAHGIGILMQKNRNRRLLSARQRRLQQLTPEEKDILRVYIDGYTRSMYLPIDSGVVQGLVVEKIIFRSSTLNNPNVGLTAFAHNIQPWAWDYLNEHRDLLG